MVSKFVLSFLVFCVPFFFEADVHCYFSNTILLVVHFCIWVVDRLGKRLLAGAGAGGVRAAASSPYVGCSSLLRCANPVRSRPLPNVQEFLLVLCTHPPLSSSFTMCLRVSWSPRSCVLARHPQVSVKGPNMARGGWIAYLKKSTNSLEQEVSKKQSVAFCSSSKRGCLQATYPTILVTMITKHTSSRSSTSYTSEFNYTRQN